MNVLTNKPAEKSVLATAGSVSCVGLDDVDAELRRVLCGSWRISVSGCAELGMTARTVKIFAGNIGLGLAARTPSRLGRRL